MSSTKAQIESDTRTLVYKAGSKYGVHVITISDRPFKLRAVLAMGKEAGQKTFIKYTMNYLKVNAPLAQDLYGDHVGNKDQNS